MRVDRDYCNLHYGRDQLLENGAVTEAACRQELQESLNRCEQ